MQDIAKDRIRNAATVIVLRDADNAARILMGQRGSKAAFMPNKFVFPGGAVDDTDAGITLGTPLAPECAQKLRDDSVDDISDALAAAAIRELYEETGQVLGTPGAWPDAPEDWAGFAATGHRPHAAPLEFFFRALTPPGRPRRFDARFFVVRAEALVSDPDDFSAASDELSHLQWVPLSQARRFDMPFITEVVLSEVQAMLDGKPRPGTVPFFKNDDEESLFVRLGGRALT